MCQLDIVQFTQLSSEKKKQKKHITMTGKHVPLLFIEESTVSLSKARSAALAHFFVVQVWKPFSIL